MEKPTENFVHREGTPTTEVGKNETNNTKLINTQATEYDKKVDVKPVEKKLTPEQEDVLTKQKVKKAEKEKKDLIKKQKTYIMLQQGAYFMKFIYNDIERMKKDFMNRTQRRRFTKELRKGIFSPELIDVYLGKIDQAVDWIEKNLNNPTQTKNKVATHYHTQGYENGEFLKTILEDFFKGKFLLPGEEVVKEVDGEKFYKDLKEKESKG